MSEMLIPAQWRRQNPFPLDASDNYTTYAAMEAYIASATAYAGQVLYCAETDKLYLVKLDKSLEPLGVSYTDPDGATADVGGWEKGDTANEMSIQDALYRLFHQYVAPTVQLTANPSNPFFEARTSIPTSSFTAVVTRGSDPITSIAFIVDNTVVQTYTENVADGGTYTYNRNTAIRTTSTIKVSVTDSSGNPPVETAVSYTPVYPSFFGVVDTATPTAQVIMSLTKDLLEDNVKIAEGINMTNQRFCYAFPSEYYQLAKITDSNGLDITDAFRCTHVVDIVGIHPYYCYTMTDTASITNGSFKFE